MKHDCYEKQNLYPGNELNVDKNGVYEVGISFMDDYWDLVII